ncbi:SAG-related sequence SRS20C [Toxoplasma gondii ME49]|uniref:SAG-related sequence SRS20C n=1 Tax=Toxoplasma gondii (strain ATCC 50611 / Me49) TaxID=508771 RepID=S8GGT9_TOXGM|nr:SAG-related sequence SRS20C [Toxoplasma gondii ME49]EPT31070.1 SAG-related sequence SRS20C [Toxoplasma gondii ME49]|eukprot:XP_018637803.1 SAG-related sequence SRS20C [Toxoplasma gondii ME49]
MAPKGRVAVPGRQYTPLEASFSLIFLCTLLPPVVAQAAAQQCTASTSVLSLTATATGKPVQFTCGENVTHLYPQQSQGGPYTACANSSCTSIVSEDLPKATLTNGSEKQNTFTLTENPAHASTVYLKCSSIQPTGSPSEAEQRDQVPTEQKCTVQIAVWGPPTRGSTAHPEPSKCGNDGATLNLEVESPNGSVTFACGEGETLAPPLFDQVFTTEECSGESPLATHLSGASLVQHGTAPGETTKSAYTFRVTNLPKNETTFCYKCKAASVRKANGNDGDKCTVFIKVAKEKFDTGSTTAAPPGESGAERGPWNMALMISLVTIPSALMKTL